MKDYQMYYQHMMRQLLMMILPFFVILLTMDHDQPYLKPLMSYFGRPYIIFYKIIFFILILTWLYLMLFMLYHILPTFLTYYYHYDHQAMHLWINLYLDGLMMLMMTLYVIRDKHKALAVLICIFYILYTWLIEDYPFLYLYYLFPVYTPYFSSYTLAYCYKICYICLGLSLISHKMRYEAL